MHKRQQNCTVQVLLRKTFSLFPLGCSTYHVTEFTWENNSTTRHNVVFLCLYALAYTEYYVVVNIFFQNVTICSQHNILIYYVKNITNNRMFVCFYNSRAYVRVVTKKLLCWLFLSSLNILLFYYALHNQKDSKHFYTY